MRSSLQLERKFIDDPTVIRAERVIAMADKMTRKGKR
jgi:hypothetical protein